MKKFLVFIVLAMIAVGGVWSARQLGYFGAPGSQVIFVVEKGKNFSSIAYQLQQQGVISSERLFRWYVNFLAKGKSLKRGEFGLYQNMPIPEVVRVLSEGKPIEYKLTVPEGYNIFQIAELLEMKGFGTRAGFLAAARDPDLLQLIPTNAESGYRPKSIEGYIYPDTYFLQKVHTSKEIAQIMLTRFREVYASIQGELQNSAAVRELQLNPHQVITLASIVEKETGAGSERPLVASVFVNRLRKKMRLQTDPTVIYGVWVTNGKWDGNIRRRDLNTPNDYNTYQMSGLPPGPIASPGLSSIKAVLAPAESDYLFFVSRNDGTHIFSRDYGAHNRAVKETQLAPNAKEGKSWRDLPEEMRAR